MICAEVPTKSNRQQLFGSGLISHLAIRSGYWPGVAIEAMRTMLVAAMVKQNIVLAETWNSHHLSTSSHHLVKNASDSIHSASRWKAGSWRHRTHWGHTMSLRDTAWHCQWHLNHQRPRPPKICQGSQPFPAPKATNLCLNQFAQLSALTCTALHCYIATYCN